MRIKVNSYNVRKGKPVTLSKDLPLNHGFGNRDVLKEGIIGYVKSNGFEIGKLKVEFWTHAYGTQNVEFNIESAANFLTTEY